MLLQVAENPLVSRRACNAEKNEALRPGDKVHLAQSRPEKLEWKNTAFCTFLYSAEMQVGTVCAAFSSTQF